MATLWIEECVGRRLDQATPEEMMTEAHDRAMVATIMLLAWLTLGCLALGFWAGVAYMKNAVGGG